MGKVYKSETLMRLKLFRKVKSMGSDDDVFDKDRLDRN